MWLGLCDHTMGSCEYLYLHVLHLGVRLPICKSRFWGVPFHKCLKLYFNALVNKIKFNQRKNKIKWNLYIKHEYNKLLCNFGTCIFETSTSSVCFFFPLLNKLHDTFDCNELHKNVQIWSKLKLIYINLLSEGSIILILLILIFSCSYFMVQALQG